MKTATRMMAVAALFATILVLAMAPPAAASNRYWATGTGGPFYLPLGPYCGQAITYPANTPLIIAHGWGDTPWLTEPLKGGFMAPTTTFVFLIDGVVQKSTQFDRYFPAVDTMSKVYVSEYDQGLTGTHDFLGVWLIDGALVGGTPHEAVLFGLCPVTVSFT